MSPFMRQLLKPVTILFLLSGATSAVAQIANGSFDQYGQSWNWKRFHSQSGLTCSQSYPPPPLVSYTPLVGADIVDLDGRTRVARIIGSHTGEYASGIWYYCGAIESSQPVYFPPGKRLQFTYKIGEALSAYGMDPEASGSGLSVYTINSSGSRALLSGTYSGKSKKRDTQGNCWFCPAFGTTEVSVQTLWGQSRTLQLFAAGSHRLTTLYSTAGSPVYIDDIKLIDEPANPSASPKSGSWYNPDRSGHGLNISRTGTGQLVLTWYTYNPNGTPVWYTSEPRNIVNGVWSSPLLKVTRNTTTGSVTHTQVGDIRLKFFSNQNAMFYWDLHAINGDNSGFDGEEFMVHLFGGGSYTGQWYEPAASGWGFNVDYESSATGGMSAVTVFFYQGSQPVWAQGTSSGAPTGNKNFSVKTFTGTGLCPQCTGPVQTQSSAAGGITLNLTSTGGSGWVGVVPPSGPPNWVRGSSTNPLQFTRLTIP